MNETGQEAGFDSIEIVYSSNPAVKIAVIGAGGCGCNIVNRIRQDAFAKESSLTVAVAAMQERNLVVKTASSDRSKTNPETGRELVKKHKNALEAVIRGHDVIVITCALGGSIGSGAAPVIAAMAKELGVMIIAAVILPTRMETDNSQKGKVVDDALAGLILPAGTVIMVSNQEVFEQCDANMTVKQAYKKADDILIDKIGGAVAAKAARHLKGLKDRIN